MSELLLGGPLVVVSPHLDDGVFSCGQLLAAHPGSTVITVLAGRPAAYGALTAWDEAGGFREGEDVVAVRRAEDEAALAHLRARPVWLDFCEVQYECEPSEEEIADALEAAIARAAPAAVFLPIGVFHSEHHLTSDAGLCVLRRRPEWTWFAYEDAIYRRLRELFEERLAALRAAGLQVTLAGTSSERGREAKRRAIAEYRSQLRALAAPGYPGVEDAYAPERYWRLTPASPRASEGGTTNDA